MVKKVGSLEIDEDFDFTRSAWAVKRAGWAAMALLIVAAILGLFGTMGPLSKATAGEDDGPLRVEYRRFARYLAPMALSAHVAPGMARGGEIRLWVSRDLMAHSDVLGIVPEPDSVEAGADRLTYVFLVADPREPVEIDFNLRLQEIGRLAGGVGLEDGPQLGFVTFIYP